MLQQKIAIGLSEKIISIVENLGAETLIELSTNDNRMAGVAKDSFSNLVTELDLSNEAFLRKELTLLYPGAHFIGEETDEKSVVHTNWIVDPIDGTTNIIHGVQRASIAVALIINNTAEVGVVHDIFRQKTYYAVRGAGAFQKTAQENVSSRLSCSDVAQLSSSLIAFGLPYDKQKATELFTAAHSVFVLAQDLRRTGSSALDLVEVATGNFDGFFELDLRVWDIAAASLIVEEAGGTLSSWAGKPLALADQHSKISVIAANSLLHPELLQAVTPQH